MRASGRQQRGVALITALVVVALAAVIATDMLWKTFLDQRRTETVLHGNQARQYLRGGEDWAAHILRRDAEETDSDNLSQPWARGMPPLPVDGGQIIGRLEDRQGLFNLNNLYAPPDGEPEEKFLEQFRRLLETQDIPREYAERVVDWIDKNQTPLLSGAEDNFYLGLDPAYRTAGQLIQTVSELRLIDGFRETEVYERIEPYVTALPTVGTTINVNTAPGPVLASLSDGEAVPVEQILMVQEDGGFEQIEDFYDLIGTNVPVDVDVDVTSHFFRLTVRADIGTASTTMYSLLFRDESSGSTVAVHRSLGAL